MDLPLPLPFMQLLPLLLMLLMVEKLQWTLIPGIGLRLELLLALDQLVIRLGL